MSLTLVSAEAFEEHAVSGVDLPVRVRFAEYEEPMRPGLRAVFYASNEMNLWLFDSLVDEPDADWLENVDPWQFDAIVRFAVCAGVPWGSFIRYGVDNIDALQNKACANLPDEVQREELADLVRLRKAIRLSNPVLVAEFIAHRYLRGRELS